MNNLNELKKAIIMAEHIAHNCEERAAYYSEICASIGSADPKDRFGIQKSKSEAEKDAKLFRIAAACMWEKLERLEKEAATC